MAIAYDDKYNLMPPGYSLYGGEPHLATYSAYRHGQDGLKAYETYKRKKDEEREDILRGQPMNEQENIAYRDKYSVPTKPDINDPTGAYAQVTDRQNDINNAAAYSAYMHGKNADNDITSDERYQELLAKREDLRSKIQKLTADIAYQEKLRALEMKNDPMWDIAKQQYIMKGDSSGLEHIMARIEAEKGRKITQKTADDAKKQESEAKQESKNRVYRNRQRALDWAMQEYLKDNAKPENRRAVFSAYQDLVDAAEDAGANIVKDEQLIQQKYGVNLRETLGLDSLGFGGAGASANVPPPPQGNPDDDNTATMYAQNFDAATGSSNMAEVYKEAKASGKVDANTLNGWKIKIEQTYAAEKKKYDDAKKVYDDAEDLVQKWNAKDVKTKQTWDRFLTTYNQRPGIKYVGVNALDKSYTASNKATEPKNEPKKPEL